MGSARKQQRSGGKIWGTVKKKKGVCEVVRQERRERGEREDLLWVKTNAYSLKRRVKRQS